MFSDTGLAIDKPLEMLLGEIPLTCPAATKGIDQAQAFVELRVCPGRGRGRWIQRKKRLASGLALSVGPDGDRVIAGQDEFRERQRRIGRWHSSGLATPDRRKGVANAMKHKLEDGVPVWLAISKQQAGRLCPFDCGVSL